MVTDNKLPRMVTDSYPVWWQLTPMTTPYGSSQAPSLSRRLTWRVESPGFRPLWCFFKR